MSSNKKLSASSKKTSLKKTPMSTTVKKIKSASKGVNTMFSLSDLKNIESTNLKSLNDDQLREIIKELSQLPDKVKEISKDSEENLTSKIHFCDYLKEEVSTEKLRAIFKSLGIQKHYSKDLTAKQLCQILEKERPDLMRGHAWNYLRAILSFAHWKSLLVLTFGGVGTIFFPNIDKLWALAPFTLYNFAVYGSYFLPNMLSGLKLGASYSAYQRNYARKFLLKGDQREHILVSGKS